MNLIQSHTTDVLWMEEEDCINLSVFQPFEAYFPKILLVRQGHTFYLIIDDFDKNQI